MRHHGLVRLPVLADRLWCRLQLDRLAGGRQAGYVIREDMLAHPDTVRSFRWIRWLLVAETVVGLAAIVVAVLLTRAGQTVPWAVWFRATVVLLITLTLYVFAWRAQLGYYWAYQRLRLVQPDLPRRDARRRRDPGLYPFWMVIEQIVFSLLMIGIGDVLTSDHMRATFPKPAVRASGAFHGVSDDGATSTAPVRWSAGGWCVKLKVTIAGPRADRDVVVTADVTATIGSLADRLSRARTAADGVR